jgi:hypothetical protein
MADAKKAVEQAPAPEVDAVVDKDAVIARLEEQLANAKGKPAPVRRKKQSPALEK